MHDMRDRGSYDDGGSDDSEMEVWAESAVTAVENKIRMQRREPESVAQWGNAYFRPGTAPEVSSSSLHGADGRVSGVSCSGLAGVLFFTLCWSAAAGDTQLPLVQ